MESSLAVRRGDGASTRSAKRSVKIWRPARDGQEGYLRREETNAAILASISALPPAPDRCRP